MERGARRGLSRPRRGRCRRLHPGSTPEPCRARRAELRQELQDPMPGGERAGRERMRKFISAAVRGYQTEPHMLGATAFRGSRRTCTSAASPRASSSSSPGGRGARGVPPTAVLARLLRARAAALPRQHARRTPAALPRQARVEPRRGVRRLARGTDRLSAGRRRNAPAAREGWMHNQARLVAGRF